MARRFSWRAYFFSFVSFVGGGFISFVITVYVDDASRQNIKKVLDTVWSIGVWFGLAIAAIIIGYFLCGLFKTTRSKIHRLYADGENARWSGLANVFPISKYREHETEDEGEGVDEQTKTDANNEIEAIFTPGFKIDLLLVSGYDLLRSSDVASGVCYDKFIAALQGSLNTEYRILLLNPDSPAARERGESFVPNHPERYCDSIRKVIRGLGVVYAEYPDRVEVKLYDDAPIWQMFITEGHDLLVQCAAGNMPTNKSPLYCFSKSDYSLYYGLKSVWDRRYANADPVD